MHQSGRVHCPLCYRQGKALKQKQLQQALSAWKPCRHRLRSRTKWHARVHRIFILCYSTPGSFPQQPTTVTQCTGCHRRRRQQSQGWTFLSESHAAWNWNPLLRLCQYFASVKSSLLISPGFGSPSATCSDSDNSGIPSLRPCVSRALNQLALRFEDSYACFEQGMLWPTALLMD